ncbi:hypothetical protein NC99_21660 [Sunxiuqinia dokdonensis]|uniref:Uncharacterized protein n=1 Tax=Sunxiuqinia dokdonensis TaxID=1409788 RepID=A0A0L8V9B7_9BACT|nr:hypothetical protein NC99_21660 [Sunxiuqinia dokdonensis]
MKQQVEIRQARNWARSQSLADSDPAADGRNDALVVVDE